MDMPIEISEKKTKVETNRGCCVIIGLCFTSFLLKIGLIIQTVFIIIAKNKLIAAFTLLLAASTATNIYIITENETLHDNLRECQSKISLNSTEEPVVTDNSTIPSPAFTENTEPSILTSTSTLPSTNPSRPTLPEGVS